MKKNNYRLNLATNGTHKILCSLIKPKSTILDIGCNDGYLAKLFKNAVYYGIEFSSASANKAIKNGYQEVIVGDLNKYKKIKIKKKFQTIIFADILEHLHYPPKVLNYFTANNLVKGGRVIVSLPNVANFMIRAGLLFGNFNYTKSGILDETHLHLYTLSSAKKLLYSSNLKIISTHFSSNRLGALIKVFPFLGPLLGFNLIFLCQKR